jgi:trimeric autotransporter adhesin
MSRYAIKFPFRVRIHGGEFDESARAIHREDGLKTIQAESGIVSESTIERKQMSTKTTFKRIALVTVAALGFGVMSVAPSSADNSILRFVSGDGQNATNPLSTGNGVAGAFNYVTLQTVSPAADYVVTTDSAFGTVTTGVVSADKKSFTATAAANPIQVMTPTVGTVTVQYWVRTGGVLAATAAETVTITVRASAQYLVPSAYTSYIIAGDSTTAAITDVATGADAVVIAPAAAPLSTAKSTAAANVKMVIKDALGNVVNDSVTATITIGSISSGLNIGSNVATSAAGDTNGAHQFWIWSNGSAGNSVVTFKVGTVTWTEAITFSGLAATHTSALADATIATGKNVPVAGTVSYKVTARDSVGNLVPDGTLVYGYSATATNATVTTSAGTVSGVATMVVTGVAAGTSVITFGNAATLATSTVTSTQTVEVTKSTAATVTMTLDQPQYNPGDKIKLTITATDSNGKGIADGTRAVLTGLASNFQLTSGSALSDTMVFLGGVASQTVYAPAVASPGNLTFTATEGAATDSTTKAIKTATAIQQQSQTQL